MHDDSCIGHRVDCYCVDRITIGARAVVSQDAFLCTAGHSIDDLDMALVTAPIRLAEDCWVAARAYVGPGVSVGRAAVLGACAVVTRDVEPLHVVAGNPAKVVRTRSLDPAGAKAVMGERG
jgi:putative colanic acid biosynthesis acetyltransferase WcaF